MKQVIRLNERPFEVQKGKLIKECAFSARPRLDIYQAYKKPSRAKVRAYTYWRAQLAGLDIHNFGVTSYSCHFFSIGFEYTDKSGKAYTCKVTPYNNYAWELE